VEQSGRIGALSIMIMQEKLKQRAAAAAALPAAGVRKNTLCPFLLLLIQKVP
jgi:hypothetical protein